MQHLLLQGQTALVTGGNSGIGKGIVERFSAEGAHVVINYNAHNEEAEALVRQIAAKGGRAIAIKADVSKEAEVVSMFRQAIETFGTIDILVNNAGIQRDASITKMTVDQWQTVLNVNLMGYFICSREAVREFMKRGASKNGSRCAGKIVCISSVHETIPWAGHVNYASSKGGIRMFVQSLAQEVAPYRIRVNSVAPGAIKTPINQSVWSNEASRKKLLKLIPYGRIGSPDDVAKAVLWLASDESDYVTGSTLVVDGGMMLYPAFSDNG